MNSPETTGYSAFRACLRFEATKMLHRRMCWAILLATLLAVAAAGWLEGRAEVPPLSWSLYAALLEKTMPLVAFFLLVTGCVAVNEEISSGSLRAVLLRPVPREMFLSCKILCLCFFALVVALLDLGAAWVWTSMHGGFSAVVVDLSSQGLESVVKFDSAEIRAHVLKLSASTLPPILCAPLFGVLISILVESTGFSVALGVSGFMVMKTVGSLGGTWAAACYPAWMDRALNLMDELSRGVETRLTLVQDLRPWSAEFLGPLLLAGMFALASLVLFQSKEIRC